MRIWRGLSVFLGFTLSVIFLPASASEVWPELSSPHKVIGGGEHDAAVIVGAENYLLVAKVPGARRNADDWHRYLTDSLQIPVGKVSLLRDNEATIEKMRRFAAQAATQVAEGGTLWFIFIGHGAPSKDGKDGLLVGVDAQQDPDGLYARSLSQNELLGILSKGKQAKAVVLIDACFSGRSPSGEILVAGLQPLVLMGGMPSGTDPRTVLLTAAKADQFAGPLPRAGTTRPGFSYLALGALRGWAADARGQVSAASLVDFARRALAIDKGRTQTPELTLGAPQTVLGLGRELAPDLGKIDREGANSATGVPPSDPVKPRTGSKTERRIAGDLRGIKSVVGTLKGISLGDSLKSIKDSDAMWRVGDERISASIDKRPVDENAPALIYSMQDFQKKKPTIHVFGDGHDIEDARAAIIILSYMNYQKMGIDKKDFLNEMKEKWGEPGHISRNKDVDEYAWTNKDQGIIGHLTFDTHEILAAPRMHVRIQYLKQDATRQHSNAKVKEILE